jgi:hypothetical protein
MLRDGFEPTNSLQHVQEYINSQYEFKEDGTIDWESEFNLYQFELLMEAIDDFYDL